MLTIFLTSSDPLMIECKNEMVSDFKMKDLGREHMGGDLSWDL